MSVGKQLLFSVLTAEPSDLRSTMLSRLTDSGVKATMFPNDDEKAAYEFIVGYRQRYGVCPSASLVEVETEIRFPEYVSQEPFDFWFDEFRNTVKHMAMLELINVLEGKLSEGKVESAVTALGNAYADISGMMAERKTTATLDELATGILEKHHLLQTGSLREGVATGFPYIDEVTGGAQPGDAWVIAGESGSGKTFVLCRCAMSAVESGKRCLFVSMEMPNMQIGRRSLAMGAGVSSSNLRLGYLSHFGVEQIQRFREQWRHTSDSRLVLVEGRISYSVNDVLAKIREFRPDVVFIDGAYMLRTGNASRQSRWEVNMEVMESLKQIAMETSIAIISSFQFDQKQKTKNLSTIMGGQAIGQIASVVLGIENEQGTEETGASNVSYKELTLYKGREGESGKIRLKYDMNRTQITQDAVIEGESRRDNNEEYEDENFLDF